MIVGYDLSPEQVYSLLKSKGIKPTFVLGPDVPEADNCIFLTFELYLKHNLMCRRSYKTYHVCADLFTLSRYSIPVSTREVQEAVIPRILPRNTLTKHLIKRAENSSLFGDLMTHIYTLPSKNVQKPITEACCYYLNGDRKYEWLEKQAKHLIQRESPRLILLKLMRKPIAEKLKDALQAVKSGMPKPNAAQEFGVQLFEVSYVLGNLNKKRNATDEYVSNQGL